MGCEHECFNEHRIEELENSLRQMQERQSDRHKEFYERIGELERKTALSENDLNHIKSTVDEMNNNNFKRKVTLRASVGIGENIIE